ncbi:MAG: hypothetical protein DRJ30_05770 [Candidatus Methanomethylicota archaeon]|nr:MAG: hypothetical protein DRJ30_05770 [Candidatus Verstraetearchaeota archaeon]
MNVNYKLKFFIVLLILIFSIRIGLSSQVKGEDTYKVDSLTLTIYVDGLIHFVYDLTCNETYPAFNLTIPTSKIDNVIIVDEEQSLIDYDIKDNNLTIYSLGSKNVKVEFDTYALTNMSEGIWTVKFNLNYNAYVKLPEFAVIIYINNMPLDISVEGNRTVLYVDKGEWEISYFLMGKIPSTSPTPGSTGEKDWENYLVTVVAIILFSISVFALLKMKRNRRDINSILKRHPDLNDDERRVLEFIVRRGEVFEAALRKKFPEIPRTTLWRMLRRMESKGILKIEKVGLQNKVKIV